MIIGSDCYCETGFFAAMIKSCIRVKVRCQDCLVKFFIEETEVKTTIGGKVIRAIF